MTEQELPLIIFVNANDTSRHTSSANTAIYPNLGLLTLMSALRTRLGEGRFRLGYFDGTVYGNQKLHDFIDSHAAEIHALCFSVLTANYGAAVAMAQRAKNLNPAIRTIFGNDHFSAVYENIMSRRPVIDAGFYGNDVVTGFTNFVIDDANQSLGDLANYPGLVHRSVSGAVRGNPELPAEYAGLPLVDYSLADSLFPHQELYLKAQQGVYFFMRDRDLRSQVVDIGRGCIKFAGERLDGIPVNACDFCGIVPGTKEIVSPEAERAWTILENVYRQGYNYFYITADELPLTLWRMLRGMAESPPEWFTDLHPAERPRMFGYTRAEAFATFPDRISTLIDVLGFDQFFIGFDGLTDISLKVMNKQSVGGRGRHDTPMGHNLRALDSVVSSGGLVTAGVVLTHLGITREIMAENLSVLTDIVDAHPKTFTALDFSPLCPIPGSQSFRYLTHPESAERRAAQFGLTVDRGYLESVKDKYLFGDEFDMDELVRDFTIGCCPDISMALVDEHIERISELADRHGIVIGGGV